MATSPTSNEVLTQNYIRAFTQRGGAGPSNPLRYSGAEEQYLMVGDISNPVRGGVSAINVSDPRRRGAYRRIGVTIDAPDIPSNTITFKQKNGGPPWYNFDLTCPANIYEVEGLCGDPSDLKNGWNTIKILSQGLATNRQNKGRTPFDGAAEATADIAFTWMGGTYDIGGIVLGETGAVEVTTEVVDIAYGNQVTCANCGPRNDGTRTIYALQQTAGGSSAVAAKVLYSTDYGSTWAASTVTGIGNGALATAIDIVGSYLVVLVKSDNAYYISAINQNTGAPGAWTKVGTGFVAAKTPNDMYVDSPNRVYFVGDGGYIYVSTDITAGVSVLSAAGTTTQNLTRIHGADQTLFAGGASAVLLKSTNAGRSWGSVSGITGAVSAIACQNNLTAWVGTSAGKVFVTETSGDIWTDLSGAFAGTTAIQDIVFATAEVGYVAATVTGNLATIFGTFTGGRQWDSANTSRFPGAQPTFARGNRIAVPLVPDAGTAANNIAVAGLSGGLTDGVVYIGSANIQ